MGYYAFLQAKTQQKINLQVLKLSIVNTEYQINRKHKYIRIFEKSSFGHVERMKKWLEVTEIQKLFIFKFLFILWLYFCQRNGVHIQKTT